MQSKIAELLHQYFELGVAEGREGRNHDTEAGDAQRVLSEIEAEIAALSAAEPVAWMHPTAGWVHVGKEVIEAHCRKGGPGPAPLYVAPPAPSVDVKALTGVIQATGYERLNGKTGKSEFFIDGHTFTADQVRSALSAQVQDVAGNPIGYMRKQDNDGNSFWVHRVQNAYYSEPVYAAAPAKQEGGE
jgi:hypothetical protein